MADLYDIEADGSVVLSVFVQPSAARAGVVGRHGDALKARVSAPPEDGKANAAVLELIANELGVRRAEAELVAGRTSRAKGRLRTVTPDRLRRWLSGYGMAD